MFCLDLKQAVFTTLKNHIIFGHSACDVCVSVAVKPGDAVTSGRVTPECVYGEHALPMSYFPCTSLL